VANQVGNDQGEITKKNINQEYDPPWNNVDLLQHKVWVPQRLFNFSGKKIKRDDFNHPCKYPSK
jgi:hypothetical protein